MSNGDVAGFCLATLQVNDVSAVVLRQALLRNGGLP